MAFVEQILISSTGGTIAHVNSSRELKANVTSTGGTFAVQSSFVAGSNKVQVTGGTIASTQSGTWIIGANSGVDIGDVTINNAAGGAAVNIQDGGNIITVDGTVAATQSGTWTVGLLAGSNNVNITGATVVDNAGFTDGTTKVMMGGYIFDEVAGTALTENDAIAARVDSKRAQIHVIEDGTTRGLRTGVVDETGASAVDALAVGGGTPHDSVNSGNPMLNGFEAIAHGTNPTAVAAADRTKAYANRAGIPFVIGGHPNIISAEYNTTTSQTDDDMLGAIGAGTKVVVTSITVTASNANTVNTSFRIGFGTATLTAAGASGAVAVTKIILSHPNLAAGSGIVKGTGSGIVGIGGDGEELRITCSAPTTGSLFVQIDYYLIES